MLRFASAVVANAAHRTFATSPMLLGSRTGAIISYNRQWGFGFIEEGEGETKATHVLHWSALNCEDGFKGVEVGAVVEFDVSIEGGDPEKPRVSNVTVVRGSSPPTSLNPNVQELLLENARLLKQKQELEDEGFALRERNEALSKGNYLQQDEVNALSEEIATLTTENHALRDDISTLTNEKDALSEENATLTKDNQVLRAENATRTTENSKLEGDVVRLEEKSAALAKEKHNLKGDVFALRMRNKALSTKAAFQRGQIFFFKYRCAQLKAELARLRLKMRGDRCLVMVAQALQMLDEEIRLRHKNATQSLLSTYWKRERQRTGRVRRPPSKSDVAALNELLGWIPERFRRLFFRSWQRVRDRRNDYAHPRLDVLNMSRKEVTAALTGSSERIGWRMRQLLWRLIIYYSRK